MRVLRGVGLCLSVLLASAGTGRAQQRAERDVDGQTIYGDDDRIDLYQVKNPLLAKLADSTVGLFNDSAVAIAPGSKVAKLSTFDYGERYQLCADEPFREQRSGAFCSGSLVGPDLLMTAGHCVTSEEACKDTKFVFGFGIKEKGKLPESVPASEVYGCGKLVARLQENSGADYALVKLDRPVSGHKPLAISRGGALKKGTKLFVVGHPAGLPTKVAGGASVRDPAPPGYFVANLDTYGGNSGSAVFNAVSGKVEGILVRGENDYVWRGSCRVSNRCPNDGCRGEDVTKISALEQMIPPSGRGVWPRAEAKFPAPRRGQAFGDLKLWSDRAEDLHR